MNIEFGIRIGGFIWNRVKSTLTQQFNKELKNIPINKQLSFAIWDQTLDRVRDRVLVRVWDKINNRIKG